MMIRLWRNDNRLRRMMITLRVNDDVFAYGKLRLCLVGLRLHFPLENRQSRTLRRMKGRFSAESFDRTFSKVRGFLRRSLKSRSAEREILFALRTDVVPTAVRKESNLPRGRFALLHSSLSLAIGQNPLRPHFGHLKHLSLPICNENIAIQKLGWNFCPHFGQT